MARGTSRHVARRRRRRLTPRRWPVLLVIPALLVGAGIIDRDRDEPSQADPGTSSVSRELAALQPTASSAESLSATFFCAGGTARGDDGPVELSVVVSNAGDDAARGSVTVFGDDDRTAATDIDVPANGKVSVEAASVLEASWAAVQVEVFGGQISVERRITGDLGVDAGPCASSGSARWTLPSGSTVRGSDERLAIFNPFADDATVDIRFVSDAGVRTPRALQGFQVPGRSVRFVSVTDAVARRPVVTSLVSARAGQVVVDRLQLADGSGDDVRSTEPEDGPVTAAPDGLTVTTGIPYPARTWFFADAAKQEGGRSRLVVFNPGRVAAEVDVHVDLDDARRNGTIDPFELSIEPRGVQVLDLTAQDVIPDVGFTVTVRSVNDQPIHAELAYAVGPPSDVIGMTVTPGAPTAATSWLFGQATANDDEVLRISILNPGDRVARLTTVERLGPRGRTPVSQAVGREIPPGTRTQLELGEADADDTALLITADRPVVAQSTLAHLSNGRSTAMGVPLPESLVPAPSGS